MLKKIMSQQITVPYSPKPVFDCSQSDNFTISLEGPVKPVFKNFFQDQVITVVVNRPVLKWPSNVKNARANDTQVFAFLAAKNVQTGRLALYATNSH